MDIDREARIQARAYELWQQDGSPADRPLGHWLQAEREVDQAESVMEHEETPNVAAMREVEQEHPGVTLAVGDDVGSSRQERRNRR